MYDKTHYNIVISLQLIKINEKKRRYGIYIYSGILLSQKKKWNIAICSNMDGPRDYHTKWNQRQVLYDITYMWYLKKYKLIYIQNRNRFTDIENKLWLPKREGGSNKLEEYGISKYKLLYINS